MRAAADVAGGEGEREGAGVSLLLWLLVFAAAMAAPGLAQPGTVEPDVTRGELRAYAQLYWHWEDTGVRPREFDNFRFTDPALRDGALFKPFAEADAVFGVLYSHRLLKDGQDFLETVTLSRLLQDDPLVKATYREFTTSGKLATPFDGDGSALEAHVALAVSAMAGERYTLGGFVFTAEGLETYDLRRTPTPAVRR